MGDSPVKVYQLGYDMTERLSQINKTINEAITEQYPLEDEVKILRKALLSMGCNDKDFKVMNDFITAQVDIGKGQKAQLKEATRVIISKHDETTFKPKYPIAPINLAEKAKKDKLEAYKKL